MSKTKCGFDIFGILLGLTHLIDILAVNCNGLQDYTGKNVTSQNLYAVILGDKSKVKGGSGKVINSKPNDRIFIYYSDHGGPGVLGEYL